jgi:hypothetical protein
MNVPKRASEQALSAANFELCAPRETQHTPLTHPLSPARHRPTPRMRGMGSVQGYGDQVKAIEPARWDKISRIFAKPSCTGDDGVDGSNTL